MSSFSDKFSKLGNELGKKVGQGLNDQKDKFIELEKEFKHNRNVLKVQNLYFNDEKQQLYVEGKALSISNRSFFSDYSDITNFKPIVNGEEDRKHHGITRAVVGGALIGGAGAIVGAVTGGKNFKRIDKISIIIYFSDNKKYTVDFIDKPVKQASKEFEKAQESFTDLTSKLEQIVNQNSAS